MSEVKGLNILFVSAHFPLPLIGGERIKQYHIIKHLAKSNRVFLTTLDRNLKVGIDDIESMKAINVEPYVYHLNLISAYVNAAFRSPFGGPMEIEFFRNRELKSKINEINKENNIDLIINYFLRTAEYVRNINLPKILLAEDCRSYYQRRTSEVSDNFRQKLIRYYESVKLKKYEKDIMDCFDATTVVTEEDRQEMRKLNIRARIEIISNGVDINLFSSDNIKGKRRDMLFVGKLDCWTNIIMVRRIVNDIFPGIVRLKPDTKLHIVGANPTDEIIRYQSDSVLIHPDVPDIVRFYSNCAVFIHPHEGGSGIQNKVLEAMSCGCPVVTTDSGSRGINIVNGTNGFICKSNQDFIDAALMILNDSELQNNIGSCSKKYINDYHKWDYVCSELDSLIMQILNKKI